MEKTMDVTLTLVINGEEVAETTVTVKRGFGSSEAIRMAKLDWWKSELRKDYPWIYNNKDIFLNDLKDAMYVINDDEGNEVVSRWIDHCFAGLDEQFNNYLCEMILVSHQAIWDD